MAYYLDTSAALKLVVAEKETGALLAWMKDHEGEIVSSDLLRAELLRATRCGAPNAIPRARAVLDPITLPILPTSAFERAADGDPDLLRSIDALHLAAALELADELDGLLTYDDRLAGAAQLHGLTVIAPAD
jgi:uncharacterized protein